MSRSMGPGWRRHVRLWRSPRREVEEEFGFHVEERIDELMARGLDAETARAEAMGRFGDIEAVKHMCSDLAFERERAMRRSEWFDAMRQDVVFALRQMRTFRSLTVAAVLTLALGIGGTTAIFSVVHAVLLRPLPYDEPDRLVMIWETIRDFNRGRASAGHYHDWAELSGTFDAVSAYQARTYNLTSGGEPERVVGARVTPSFFAVQSMRPLLGRQFRPDESAARVTVLSHGLWQSRFGGDRSVLGRDILLNGEAYTVVGVMPAAFTLTEFDERLWTPFNFQPQDRTNYGSHGLLVMARLRAGVTQEAARADLERITEDIRRRHPAEMQERGVSIESFMDALVGGFRPQLYVLMGAVAFVLLIACGNVASLLLARASARHKELAIRGALGGGRGRLIRQLLTESLVLALGGGLAGLLLARFGVQFLAGMGPAGVPRLAEAGLDGGVLVFALVTTCVSGLLFGLAPALRATRTDLQSVLREGGRTARGGGARDRVRAVLIVGEMAVALVLLVSAGLLLRSAIMVQRIPLGFKPDGVSMLRIALPADRYATEPAINGAYARIIEEVRALPGVQRVGASNRVPMWGPSTDMGLVVQGRTLSASETPVAHVRVVSAEFMDVLGIPLKRGRLLTDADFASGAPRVVLMNETLARASFGDDDPIGRRVYGWSSEDNPEWREVVGVVSDVRAFGRERSAPGEIYIPYTQAHLEMWTGLQRSMAIVVKGPEGAITPALLRAALKRVDPLLPLYDVQSMGEVIAQGNAGRRFNTLLLGGLGVIGLVLAAIGIYGVIAFHVAQRTHEIGVRLALGATSGDVLRLVLGQGALLAGLGVLLGAGASVAATRFLQSLLFQVNALDPATYAGCAVVLVAVALAATLIPARRAARVPPVASLSAT